MLYSEKIMVNIESDSFISDQQKNIVKFSGHVKMTKLDDILLADKLIVKTIQDNESNKTVVKKYIGIGNVSFEFKNRTSTLKGRGDKIIYYPLDGKYIVIGNGYLEDSKDGKVLVGDKIYLNEKTRNARIEGKENKPVKFSFQIQSKENNETN
jgi:lipopolysaccharide transport protein LptA